jgi:superfamily II DNA or RNA helicase
MFGSKIVNISASYLIEHDWLVKPYILLESISSEAGWKSYAKVYENSIVKNDPFNIHVAKTANHLVSRGLSTLVLVQQYPQGDYLKELIPNCEFVSGRMSSAKRKQSIQDLRDKKNMCMIATTLADEGLDIPTLDAALLAGGGASATRVNQRIGRTLRKDKSKSKDKSIVIIYEHDAKHLDKHAKKVRRILKREKEFKLLDSKGPDFICGEIDSILGIKSSNHSVLDL